MFIKTIKEDEGMHRLLIPIIIVALLTVQFAQPVVGGPLATGSSWGGREESCGNQNINDTTIVGKTRRAGDTGR
ncbi:MAG: hypothetical protein DRN20_05680, partial [Thermoplasmata archaeon]